MDTEKLIAAAAAAAVGAFAKSAAEGVTATGRKVWDWIKGKVSATDAAMVAAVEAAPEKPSTQARIVVLLEDLLHENPAAAKELRDLLGGEAGVQTIAQTATATGSSVVNQIVGSGNTISNKNTIGKLSTNDNSLKTDEVINNIEYDIWYATNRCPVDCFDFSQGFSAKRDSKTHYGKCQVFIPRSHKIGSIGSTWWKRLISGNDDRLQIKKIEKFDKNSYWQSIYKNNKILNLSDQQAVVFIHGYNVSFRDAALRAAQIGFDLSIRGAMAFYSWPSQGSFSGYLADAAAIDASESAITEFLVDFVERSGAQAVHIIAHSMGNRGVLRAVDRIAQSARKRTKKYFGQVILAAADVDADLFRQRCAAYGQVARRATLYVSTRDLAVEASRWLHDYPRVGLMPPIQIVPGIDTVNVANVDLSQLGHGYVAEARDVLSDMHTLIRQGTPPQRRFGLRAENTPQGGKFWIIGA